jgi:hypothetical protein
VRREGSRNLNSSDISILGEIQELGAPYWKAGVKSLAKTKVAVEVCHLQKMEMKMR